MSQITVSDKVPDGMMVLWTIEKETKDGIYIHDLVDTQEEAAKIIEKKKKKKGSPWTTTRLVLPYRKPDNEN